jgi:hypothetical protein
MPRAGPPSLTLRVSAFWAALGLALSGPVALAAEPPPTVMGARLGVHPDKTRVVIELSRPVPFTVRALDNPSRVVLDLPDVTVPADTHLGRGGLVRGIAQGTGKGGGARLTFDLTGPARIRQSFVLPPAEGYSTRLVLDLEPGPPGATGNAASAAVPAPPSSPSGPPAPPVPVPASRPAVAASGVASGAAPAASRPAATAPSPSPRVAPPPAGDEAPGAVVLATRVKALSDRKTRIEFELSGTVPFRARTASAPERVELMLPDMVWPSDTDPLEAISGGLVLGMAREPGEGGGTRVTIDLTAPARLRQSVLLPSGDGFAPRLVLELEAAGGPPSARVRDTAP